MFDVEGRDVEDRTLVMMIDDVEGRTLVMIDGETKKFFRNKLPVSQVIVHQQDRRMAKWY